VPLIRLEHGSRHDLSAHQRHVDEARRLAVRKGGQRIIVSMRVSPIESKTGALDGISLIARDIVGAGDRTAPDSDPHSVRGNGGPAS